MDNKYSNGKIYRLQNTINNHFYIGSTCKTLTERLSKHKSQAKASPRPVHHCFNTVGWSNVEIILLENFPCQNKLELLKQERYWIEQLNPTLNIDVPSRTRAEWIEENKDYFVEYQKQYREHHKEELAKQQKEYYDVNKDKLIQYQKDYNIKNKEKVKERKKKYSAEHKEHLAVKKREWYDENKDKVKSYIKEYAQKNKEHIARKKKEWYEKRKLNNQVASS